MKSYVLVSNKSWHDSLFSNLKKSIPGNWTRITSKDKLTYLKLKELNPDCVFIPHWSYIIPENIYENFKCVVFHMTDLPFGRGGSPLQNLIERGYEKTMLSAIKVAKELDAGDIYLKAPLSLSGTAQEIFVRSSKIIQEMIKEIIKTNPVAKKQKGEVVNFKRRTPGQSNIAKLNTLNEVFDHIRMLDCEGYPNAFLETRKFRFEFYKASLQSNNSITANVRITKK